jgi:hypothetical protein
MVWAGMSIDGVICKSCPCPELLFAQGLALVMTKHYIPIWEYVKHRKHESRQRKLYLFEIWHAQSSQQMLEAVDVRVLRHRSGAPDHHRVSGALGFKN